MEQEAKIHALWEDLALRLAMESLVLEQWLRFYCLEEIEGVSRVCPTKEARSQIAAKATCLLPLFDSLAGKEAEAQAACAAVVAFVGGAFPDRGEELFTLPDFQARVAQFQTWVLEQADLLDSQEADFSVWVQEALAPARA